MTNDQATRLYKAMEEYFGDDLPSFEHCPVQFAHFVKMFKYYKGDVWAATLM